MSETMGRVVHLFDPARPTCSVRQAMTQLRENFPGWAFVYDDTTGWVAAPGHELTPRLRVLRSSARKAAPTLAELWEILRHEPRPARRP